MSFIQMTRMVQASLLMVVVATLGAQPAVGQEFFKASKAEVDLTTYTNIYDCMAALQRVERGLSDRELFITGAWRDTMPYDPEERFRPHPAIVGESARTCLDAASESAASAPHNAWRIVANLYLNAGAMDSARAVVERRLAAVKEDSLEQLVTLLTQVQFLYYGKGIFRPQTRPILPDIGDDIVLAHVGRLPTLQARLHVYMQMMVTAGEEGYSDDGTASRMEKFKARLIAHMDSLTQDAAQGLADRGLIHDDLRMTPEKARERLEGMASYYLGNFARLEYLRESTKAYEEVTRNVFSQATGNPPEGYPWPLGQLAPRLEGDIWFGCEEDPCEEYPRKGRVSLVVYHTPEVRYRHRLWMIERPLPGLVTPIGQHDGCAQKAIPVRRLQDQYPEIDIIVVSRTLGHYHYAKEEVTPEREAELLYECFKAMGLKRVVVTMTKTPGWRLPEPDGRLARQPEVNWTNYSFGGLWTDADRDYHGSDFIVDQDGHVITLAGRRAEQYAEVLYSRAIRVLLERERART